MRSAVIVWVCAAVVSVALANDAYAAKVSECTLIGLCYCVNDELKPTIGQRVERFRERIAAERTAGKSIGYLSVPLSSAGGGSFNVNRDVAESIRAAIEKRYGTEYVYVL